MPERPTLSVAIITFNEEVNIRRTLESVKWAHEIVIVDSGSTDRTCAIARQYGAKIFVEEWKGFAAQKNSALDKCTGDWILSLDADEEVSPRLAEEINVVLEDAAASPAHSYDGYWIPRKNQFLGRWIRRGGFYPDRKLRMFRRGKARTEARLVHEDFQLSGTADELEGDILHHAYPTLSSYIEHMNRYSSLGAEMLVEKTGRRGFSIVNILLRPWATFVYNYFFRLGFLDGKEGLLLHLYHSIYVSWKYAKAWELSRQQPAKG
jgi:glycosyltransferase involved in cell wall biosynthesis